MAVEYLVLNITGPKGRKPGVVCNVKTCKDGETVKWGSAERPPDFFVVHVDGVTAEAPGISKWFVPSLVEHKDRTELEILLNAEPQEFFRLRSRFLFNKSKLTPADALATFSGEGRIHLTYTELQNMWIDQYYDARAAAIAGEPWDE